MGLPKYLKLPASETFVIQTALSRAEVIAKMEALTTTFTVFSFKHRRKSPDPRFFG